MKRKTDAFNEIWFEKKSVEKEADLATVKDLIFLYANEFWLWFSFLLQKLAAALISNVM